MSSENSLRDRIHRSAFVNSGIATGFLHEITGLGLTTGDGQEAKILIDHLYREYNKKCFVGTNVTGLMINPYDSSYRPTAAAAGAAAVDFGGGGEPAPTTNIVQFAGDDILTFAGDNIIQF